jgi:hypothetical protein
MLEQFKTLTAVILLACMAAPGCSSFSKQARREAAYRKYVRKARHDHDKQLAKATKAANRPLRKPVFVGEPTQTITTTDSSGSEN